MSFGALVGAGISGGAGGFSASGGNAESGGRTGDINTRVGSNFGIGTSKNGSPDMTQTLLIGGLVLLGAVVLIRGLK